MTIATGIKDEDIVTSQVIHFITGYPMLLALFFPMGHLNKNLQVQCASSWSWTSPFLMITLVLRAQKKIYGLGWSSKAKDIKLSKTCALSMCWTEEEYIEQLGSINNLNENLQPNAISTIVNASVDIILTIYFLLKLAFWTLLAIQIRSRFCQISVFASCDRFHVAIVINSKASWRFKVWSLPF